MPVTAVIGGQWGDEGKGKIVDLLGADMDLVARYQGGANAGHTVITGDQTFILHQVPADLAGYSRLQSQGSSGGHRLACGCG